MPHVVLNTHSPLHELTDGLEPFVERADGTVWRLRDIYLSTQGRHALAECLVVAEGRLNRFLLHLAQRESDASVVIRPYPVPRVDATPSVKRMVALVAEAIRRHHPDVEIGATTVRDFLSDRYRYEPDPEPGGWDPMLPDRGLPQPLDWSATFGNPGPVEIEIGSGKGTFLVDAALASPEKNFLSVEWAGAYAEHLRDRIRRRGLRNARVVRADAGRLLADAVRPGSVRRVHLYFPDPWPKKRHHKRRLVTPTFAAAVAEALAPGGELRFVTDHEDYFQEATAILDAEPRLDGAAVPDDMIDLTNYERKYRAQGRSIHRALYRRVAS